MSLRLPIAAACAATVALSTPAAAFSPGDPPNLCAGDFYADVIGTPGDDDLTGTGRPERLYGLAGDDQLNGSENRVSCLIGGPGDDLLQINDGGGLEFGEAGSDTLQGSPLDDQLYGGGGRDAYGAGDGDDKVDARDGIAEVVDCSDGNDLATADRIDLLAGCETVLVDGRANPTATVKPRAARVGAPFVATLRAPFSARAGAYRVILTTDSLGRDCADGPVVVGKTTRSARAGHELSIRLRPPHGEHWCRGTSKAGIVYYRGRRPGRPVARLQFDTR
ncbi:MAG: hypothetical protein QOF76_3511 [Solirubrobacteraceae bacterium]|jgi:Ca2+-binding RTX toxin-like protein|nr:hypothetical protein [Solirubrobacteraceae bacterium]